MNKEEFLRELGEALAGEVPEPVIRDNISYYGSYLTQEMAKGRTVDEIAAEIGEPFIVAKTIIESSEAAGETVENDGYGNCRESYTESRSRDQYQDQDQERQRNPYPNIHYIDLNKWYWKLLGFALLLLTVMLVFNIVGGIFLLLIRFAGPLAIVFLVVWFIRNLRR